MSEKKKKKLQHPQCTWLKVPEQSSQRLQDDTLPVDEFKNTCVLDVCLWWCLHLGVQNLLCGRRAVCRWSDYVQSSCKSKTKVTSLGGNANDFQRVFLEGKVLSQTWINANTNELKATAKQPCVSQTGLFTIIYFICAQTDNNTG